MSRFQGCERSLIYRASSVPCIPIKARTIEVTEAAGGTVDKPRLTQVHRALPHQGITRIPAYSPEARGRSERVFRTLQERRPKELALAELLCVREERVVAKDTTVRYQGRHRQIPPDRRRFHDVTVAIRVHQYPDETLAVCHGPRCLARDQPDGRVSESEGAPPSRADPAIGRPTERGS